MAIQYEKMYMYNYAPAYATNKLSPFTPNFNVVLLCKEFPREYCGQFPIQNQFQNHFKISLTHMFFLHNLITITITNDLFRYMFQEIIFSDTHVFLN